MGMTRGVPVQHKQCRNLRGVVRWAFNIFVEGLNIICTNGLKDQTNVYVTARKGKIQTDHLRAPYSPLGKLPTHPNGSQRGWLGWRPSKCDHRGWYLSASMVSVESTL